MKKFTHVYLFPILWIVMPITLLICSSQIVAADNANYITPPLGIDWRDGFVEVLAKVKALNAVENVETKMIPQVFWPVDKVNYTGPRATTLGTPIGEKDVITTGIASNEGPRITARNVIVAGVPLDLDIEFSLAPELVFTKPKSCLLLGQRGIIGLVPTHIVLSTKSPGAADCWKTTFADLREKYKDAGFAHAEFNNRDTRPDLFIEELPFGKHGSPSRVVHASFIANRFEIWYTNEVDVINLKDAFAKRLSDITLKNQKGVDDLLDGL